MLYNALRRRANLKLIAKNARKASLGVTLPRATATFTPMEEEIPGPAMQTFEASEVRGICTFYVVF